MAAADARRWKASGAAARPPGSTGFSRDSDFTNRAGASIRLPMSARDSRGWAGARTRPISRSPCPTPTTRCSATAFRITGCSQTNYTSVLFGSRQHRQPLPFFQFHRPAYLQRQSDVHRQCLVTGTFAPKPSIPISTTTCSGMTSISRRRQEQAVLSRRGIYGLPNQRRQHHEHAVSEMALHRRSAHARRQSGQHLRWREHLLEGSAERVRVFRAIHLDHQSEASGATNSPPERHIDRNNITYTPDHRLRLCPSELHSDQRSSLAGWIHRGLQWQSRSTLK